MVDDDDDDDGEEEEVLGDVVMVIVVFLDIAIAICSCGKCAGNRWWCGCC